MEKNQIIDYQVELRCEEAREVMSRIPPAIVRWGTTVMMVIVGALVTAACMIDWPIPTNCPCIVTVNESGSCKVIIKLPPEIVRTISNKGVSSFSIEVPLLGGNTTLNGTVDLRHLNSDKAGVTTATVFIDNPKDSICKRLGIISFDADAVFLISNKKLIFHIFPFLQNTKEWHH